LFITLYETKNLDPIKIEEYIEATNIENKLSRDESNAAELSRLSGSFFLYISEMRPIFCVFDSSSLT
jgi:hypothetical protein